jgi:hypothetical protein
MTIIKVFGFQDSDTFLNVTKVMNSDIINIACI